MKIYFLLLVSLSSFSFEYQDTEHSRKTVLLDQAIVFSGHTLGYLATQYDVVKEEGSFTKYRDNFLEFRFDADSTSWNYFGHGLTGAQVYLYYRARGYEKRKAFFYSFLSSLYFEVLIENYTEPPSLQDTFHTPFFGSILGFGIEKASLYLINSDFLAFQFIGRVLNPFSYFAQGERFSLTPYLGNGRQVGLSFGMSI